MTGYLSHLYLLNVAVSWGLLLLIWIVQIIVYPGFARIGPGDFIDYHRWYAPRISAIVTPLMICEVLICAAWIRLEGYSLYPMTAAGLVLIVWISTFSLQVPLHRRLRSGKHDARIGRLVATNWIRTAAWSVKAVVVVMAAAGHFAGRLH